MKKEVFYISNLISLSRFLLLGITAFYLLNSNYLTGIIFIILIWISDLLDGYFARSRNEISELGKIIDPLADKAAVITIILILAFQGIIPAWFVIIVITRDVLILIGGLYLNSKKNIVLQSNWAGKVAVFTIGLTFVFAIVAAASRQGQFGYHFSYHIEILELLYLITIFISLTMIFFSIASYFNRFLTILKK